MRLGKRQSRIIQPIFQQEISDPFADPEWKYVVAQHGEATTISSKSTGRSLVRFMKAKLNRGSRFFKRMRPSPAKARLSEKRLSRQSKTSFVFGQSQVPLPLALSPTSGPYDSDAQLFTDSGGLEAAVASESISATLQARKSVKKALDFNSDSAALFDWCAGFHWSRFINVALFKSDMVC